MNAFLPSPRLPLRPWTKSETPSPKPNHCPRRQTSPFTTPAHQRQPTINSLSSLAQNTTSINNSCHIYFATCARGLGEVLSRELQSPHIDAHVLRVASSGVRFTSHVPGHGTAYAACLWLRTATRVLHHLFSTSLSTTDDDPSQCLQQIYDFVVSQVDWPVILSSGQSSYSVSVRVDAPGISSHTVQVRVKDAICDALRNANCRLPARPENHASADVPLFVTIHANECVVYRDMAGASLHKRGYRSEGVIHKSVLNESVAAGMLYMSGFRPDGGLSGHADDDRLVIVDPMCGSGTLLIEAALLRLQVAVGLYRRTKFPFEHWHDFDKAAYTSVRNIAKSAQQSETAGGFRLLGSDVNSSALSLAKRDVDRTRLSSMIRLEEADIRDVKLRTSPTMVVSNPPWGMRLDENDAWFHMGQFLRNHAADSTATLLSGDATATRSLKMKARERHPVRIGNVDTRVLLYDVLPKRRPEDVSRPDGTLSAQSKRELQGESDV